MGRSTENRDPERRRASKRAYYQRNKERLQEKARERAKARYKQDPAVRFEHRRAVLAYRTLHADELRVRRLNLYRKAYLLKNGVDAFRTKFISRLSASERESIPHGYLLEDREDWILRRAYEPHSEELGDEYLDEEDYAAVEEEDYVAEEEGI
ncbi:hypothetical protein EV121DRAFT_218274 [Schizophyllum commune]